MTRHFLVDPGIASLLDGAGIRHAGLLRRADLPEDLLTRIRPSLPLGDFQRLWEELTNSLPGKAVGLILADEAASQAFSPSRLAVCCSPDLTLAVERVALYKSLISPLQIEVHDTLGGLEITYGTEASGTLPTEFIAGEMSFLISLVRLASQRNIRPVAVEMLQPPSFDGYKVLFGRPVRKGPFNRVVFTREDAKTPFPPADPSLFARFAPDLRTRLDHLDRSATIKDRVRAVLMEALPGGQGETALVAKRLGISSRGLQRKLAGEKTSFQSELRSLRCRLAKDYLATTQLTNPEIAFLLGYGDPNSFIRAFHIWTNATPQAYRSAARPA